MLEFKDNRQVQELFNKHHEELKECLITGAQMEIDSNPIVSDEKTVYFRNEKRIITYEGYTKSLKKFTLTIED